LISSPARGNRGVENRRRGDPAGATPVLVRAIQAVLCAGVSSAF
jgi:hypothetical protein